ncbi:MAG: ABC transporter substrate-binding protein [Bacillota bacterium]|nr:ABC transporter substrate-binding protein [Bacillota bacterium]
MKKIIALLLCVVTLFALCACTAEEPVDEPEETESVDEYAPVSFENHGKDITVKEMPQKVVTAGPNCTELFCALGLSDMVIGKCMSNHSIGTLEELSDDYYSIPDIAVGYPTYDQLAESGCDFLCTTDWIFGEELTIKSLENAGITVFVMNSDSIGDMYGDIRTIAKIFDVSSEAEELISADAAEISDIAVVLPEEPLRVLVLDSFFGDKLYVTGAYGYENELINSAGGVNVFADLENDWDAVSLEDVVDADPDFIIIHDYQGSDYNEKLNLIQENPELSQLECVKSGRILCVPLENTFPGVRCSLTVEMIATAMYPDLF